jgi:hypothetical protein
MDLGGRRYQNVMLGLNEKQQSDNEQGGRPEVGRSLVGGLSARHDRRKNRVSANPADKRNQEESPERALHLSANELKKRHKMWSA